MKKFTSKISFKLKTPTKKEQERWRKIHEKAEIKIYFMNECENKINSGVAQR